MAPWSSFSGVHLRSICDVLADTGRGLTGSEITKLLSACSIAEVAPSLNKRERLFESLSSRQARDRCGNNVIAFIQAAMNPVRYTKSTDLFHQRLADLNEVLVFSGLKVDDNGCVRTTSLSQAGERARRLQRELSRRAVHADVLRFCRTELLQDNYFHAVFEATKSVADKIRDKSGCMTDGSTLVDEVFGKGKDGWPLLAFNSLQTDTEWSEHRGLMNLLKGLFGTFRNTTAHAPKIYWQIEEQDAMDMLSLASLLHRRLDEARKPYP